MSFIACFFYAIHNYLISYGAILRPSMSSVYPQWMTYLSFFLVYHAFLGIQNIQKGDKFWNRNNSMIYKGTDKNAIDYLILFGLILRAIGSVGGFLNTYGIIRAAQIANLSPSVAMSFTSFTMFLVSLVFYLAYNEKLTIKLIMGMMLVVMAVFLVGIDKAISDYNSKESDVLKSFAPILLAILQCFFYSFNAFVVRFLGRRNYSAIRITIDYLFLYSFFALTLFVYEITYGQSYTFQEILPITGASICLVFGHICYNYGLVNATGGKVQGIVQLQCIIQLVFEIILDRRIPSIIEVIALGLGLLGAVVMADSKS
eukprot:403344374